jgi:hypothetical protein
MTTIDINALLQSGSVDIVNKFFSLPNYKDKLTDTEIVSVVFACRVSGNKKKFAQINLWIIENRPDLRLALCNGILTQNTNRDKSSFELQFIYRNMNVLERAFSLISATENLDITLLTALIDPLDERVRHILYDFIVRSIVFKFNNDKKIKLTKSALMRFSRSVVFTYSLIQRAGLDAAVLCKVKARVHLALREFTCAREAIIGLDGPDIDYLSGEIDRNEAFGNGDFQKAQFSIIEMINVINTNPLLRSNFRSINVFDSNLCAIALRRTYDILDQADVEPFLAAGTLLGMIRDGKIFDHDKDFDIGVIGWEKQFKIYELLHHSEEYDLDIRQLRGNKSFTFAAFHKPTGISLDIFFFHLENAKFVYGVDLSIGFTFPFHFSKFELIEKEFSVGNYRIPAQFEKYLYENYGDGWMLPDPQYDVFLQSPAIPNKCSDLYKAMSLNRVLNSIAKYNNDRVKQDLQYLKDLNFEKKDEYHKFIHNFVPKNYA